MSVCLRLYDQYSRKRLSYKEDLHLLKLVAVEILYKEYLLVFKLKRKGYIYKEIEDSNSALLTIYMLKITGFK